MPSKFQVASFEDYSKEETDAPEYINENGEPASEGKEMTEANQVPCEKTHFPTPLSGRQSVTGSKTTELQEQGGGPLSDGKQEKDATEVPNQEEYPAPSPSPTSYVIQPVIDGGRITAENSKIKEQDESAAQKVPTESARRTRPMRKVRQQSPAPKEEPKEVKKKKVKKRKVTKDAPKTKVNAKPKTKSTIRPATMTPVTPEGCKDKEQDTSKLKTTGSGQRTIGSFFKQQQVKAKKKSDIGTYFSNGKGNPNESKGVLLTSVSKGPRASASKVTGIEGIKEVFTSSFSKGTSESSVALKVEGSPSSLSTAPKEPGPVASSQSKTVPSEGTRALESKVLEVESIEIVEVSPFSSPQKSESGENGAPVSKQLETKSKFNVPIKNVTMAIKNSMVPIVSPKPITTSTALPTVNLLTARKKVKKLNEKRETSKVAITPKPKKGTTHPPSTPKKSKPNNTSVPIVNTLQPRKKATKKTRKSADTLNKDRSSTTPSVSQVKVPISNSVSLVKSTNIDSANNQSQPLSKELKNFIERNNALRKSYQVKAEAMVRRAIQGGLDEEDCNLDSNISAPVVKEDIKNGDRVMEVHEGDRVEANLTETEFRDEWVSDLAILVQGSSLPLQSLVEKTHSHISERLRSQKLSLSLSTIEQKIKLIAARTSYLVPIPSSCNSVDGNISMSTLPSKPTLNHLIDTNPEHMWRWELTSIDLLPEAKQRAQVHKSRRIRRKIKSHQKALIKFLQILTNNIADVLQGKMTMADFLTKVSMEEEKVLKFERKEEEARLKLQKERESTAKKEKAEAQLKASKKEKELKKKDALGRKKKEALERKRKKGVEEAMANEVIERKKKARMMSFFTKSQCSNGASGQCIDNVNVPIVSPASTIIADIVELKIIGVKRKRFDSKTFWETISCDDSGISELSHPFSTLSAQARNSRRRNTKKIHATVFATSIPDNHNPFEQQPYAEEKVIEISNRYKYLSFHEDYRPPYRGTWSKPCSSLVNGRRPFGKDTTYLDYSVDSEAEWEEGDDEQGDDCSEVGDDDEDVIDDEGDSRKYNYQDGWLAKDEDLELEGDDDETKELRKKNLENGGNKRAHAMSTACAIAPIKGGLPQVNDCVKNQSLIPCLVQGIDVNEGADLLKSHVVIDLLPSFQLCTDPFPAEPLKPKSKTTKTKANSKTKQKASKGKAKEKKANATVTTSNSYREPTQEELKIFAEFVHNSTFKSKDLLVEALRSTHKDLMSSRALALRKLDYLATKRRLPNGEGVIWEVKNEVLISLGLGKLVKKEVDLASKITVNNLQPRRKKSSTLKEKPTTPCHKSVVFDVQVVPVSPSISLGNDIVTKKRKTSSVSNASVSLLASFLKKKQKT